MNGYKECNTLKIHSIFGVFMQKKREVDLVCNNILISGIVSFKQM